MWLREIIFCILLWEVIQNFWLTWLRKIALFGGIIPILVKCIRNLLTLDRNTRVCHTWWEESINFDWLARSKIYYQLNHYTGWHIITRTIYCQLINYKLFFYFQELQTFFFTRINYKLIFFQKKKIQTYVWK